MDGILAQYIAVALHGSAWLTSRGARPTLETSNSTFQYVSQVYFEDLTGDRVDAVGEWLEWLATAGATEINLSTLGDEDVPEGGPTRGRQRAAFVDDDPDVGLWILTAEGARLWRAEWRTRHHHPLATPPPNPRPWYVTYRESPAPMPRRRPVLDATRRVLIEAITIAIEFAREHAMQPWDTVLAQARDLNEAEQPQPPFYPDMAPSGGLSLERQRLLAMATGAHVFGGMGTWNDIAFADRPTQRTYEEVSDRLFAAVMRGFSSCVNAGTRSSDTTS